MRLRDTVQSKWMKVQDLPGRENGFLDLTIARIGMSRFNDGRESLDLHFHEHPKPLGCNVTNRKRLMALFGEDIDAQDLVGRRIRVYAELTQDAKGEACWGMRIGPIPNTVAQASTAARERIEAAQLRHGVAQRWEGQDQRAAQPPRMAQDAPTEFRRPMSHGPAAGAPGSAGPVEPPGFVDDQDPGADDPFGMTGGRW